MKSYDIFISYRRDGGAETAKLIRDSLTERGYRVFLDVESLRSGPFNAQLYQVIENAKDFLIVLPPNGLDRCISEDDWVRKEIEHAKKCDKNIIPVMLRGFTFPQELPESIDFLRYQQGQAADMNYYEASLDGLEKLLKSKRHLTKQGRMLVAFVGILLVGALSFFGVRHFKSYPHNAAQRKQVSDTIAYLVLNLKQLDIASETYQDSLKRVVSFVEGSSRDDQAALKERLTHAIATIESCEANITDVSSDLSKELENSRFDTTNLDGFPVFLRELTDEYVGTLTFIRDDFIDADLSLEHKGIELETRMQMAKIDCESVIYELNKTLLPVTEDSALDDLKSEYLPEMTTLYEQRIPLTDDASTLEGNQSALGEEYNALLAEVAESQKDERAYIENNFDLQAFEQKAINLYQPTEGDDPDTLWVKGKMFLTLFMPDEAAQCFSLFAESCVESEKQGAASALQFARDYDALVDVEIEGGAVVFYREEGTPDQGVEPGDIIFEVDDQPICNLGDYDAATAEVGKHQLGVLRYGKDGSVQMLPIEFDTSLGRLAMRGLLNEVE